MESLRQILPSLNALAVFECAGRLESFSAAARELHMTQAAVSYAIAKLEDQLGTALFLREYRRVRLSEAGQRFHADVTIGLSHIQRSAQSLRATASGSHVSLACSTAFAAYWMVPRMERFRADLPDVDLRIHSADRDLDLMGEGIALGIRGGVPQDWPQYDAEALAPEEIYPVCAESYLNRNPLPHTPEELTTHTLIHLDEPFRSATTWAQWFTALGVPSRHLPRGLQINDYVLVLQSVLAGQGVALGWHHLVEGMVEQGTLVPLTDQSLSTGKAFHVIWPKQIPLSRPAALVRDWLVAQRAL
ncbi:LysR substrate-binding domain-containing protein [Xinfangfangia sp. CPCC 101601]|uniref:LysR substrate-binding domain-containing protein n=1 Tax=Pseudogemmobacter lacusdianii TaxID=3069608 RepID=A0ABU0VXY2_9RHOB|nr:LysR substrate-binding domain-containing protein [Xinfangfangia sp. CPCC 101601]MDQ2066569.1 LysR substrate-binding domain-containing protein [Xinfangfangia sp. CPCC 101601]